MCTDSSAYRLGGAWSQANTTNAPYAARAENLKEGDQIEKTTPFGGALCLAVLHRFRRNGRPARCGRGPGPGRRYIMRENLRAARKAKGMTQQVMADQLGISLRYYQNIESGTRTGDFAIWDELEDITGIHQRKLREISANRHAREDNQ